MSGLSLRHPRSEGECSLQISGAKELAIRNPRTDAARTQVTLKKSDAVEGAQKQHITSTPVNSPVELGDDPQLIHRGFIRRVELPGFGTVPFPMGSITTIFDRPLAPAPTLGQHTRALLAELGYSEPEQVALFERGVV